MDDLLALDITQVGEDAVVTARGEIDFSCSGQLESALVDLARRRVARLQLDLSAITFLDSAGIRAIVVGHRAVNVQGGAFAIVDASPQVRKVLVLAGAERLLADRRAEQAGQPAGGDGRSGDRPIHG